MSTVVAAIDNSAATSQVLRTALAVSHMTRADVMALHVVETDARYASDAASYCGVPLRLELRIGAPGDHVLDVSADLGVDMVALGWSQRLTPGRARVVRQVIEHAGVPVELVPLSEARVLTPAGGS